MILILFSIIPSSCRNVLRSQWQTTPKEICSQQIESSRNTSLLISVCIHLESEDGPYQWCPHFNFKSLKIICSHGWHTRKQQRCLECACEWQTRVGSTCKQVCNLHGGFMQSFWKRNPQIVPKWNFQVKLAEACSLDVWFFEPKAHLVLFGRIIHACMQAAHVQLP